MSEVALYSIGYVNIAFDLINFTSYPWPIVLIMNPISQRTDCFWISSNRVLISVNDFLALIPEILHR